MKKYRYLYLFFMLFNCGFVSTMFGQTVVKTDSLNLQTCIALAWKNNFTFKQQKVITEQSTLARKEAVQGLIPSLNAGLGHSLSEGRSIDPVTNQFLNQQFKSGNQYISSTITLLDGFGMFHRIREKTTAQQAVMLEETAAKEALMLDVIVAYVQVLTARDMVGQSEKRLVLTAAQLDRMANLQLQGAIQPSEYYDLKGQYASDGNALNETKKIYLNAKFTLAKLLNIADAEAIKVESLNDLPGQQDKIISPDQIFEKSVTRIPEIQAARFRIQEAEYGIKYAKSAYFPKLTTSLGFDSRYSSNAASSYWNQTKNNIGKYISFGLTIPILSGFTVKNNVNRARLTMIQAQNVLEYKQTALLQNISQNAAQLTLVEENYANMLEEETSFTESYRIATVRFEAGAMHAILFLTAKNNMEQAQAKRLIGQYEWRLQGLMRAYYNGTLPGQAWVDGPK